MAIRFDSNTMQYISIFESITNAKVMDCIENDDKIIFIVEIGHLGMAIGRKGANIVRLKNMFKKGIDIIEYSENIEQFIKNIFHNYKVIDVKIEFENNRHHALVTIDPKDKGKAIGKEGKNLRLAREIANRHHGIESMVIA